MRLGNHQVLAIKAVARQVLGDEARVILFGSRTDDDRRGGDIDLLFESPRQVDNRAVTLGHLYAALVRELGDRKIDVLLSDPATPDAPVLRAARQTGVVL